MRMLSRCFAAVILLTLSVPCSAETVAVMIRAVRPLAGNNWRISYYGATSTENGFDGATDVSLSSTTEDLHTSIKNGVISQVASLYSLTITADDITVFGAPFAEAALNGVFRRPVPLLAGATPPATCTLGQRFFDTDAAAGESEYGCTSEPSTWTVQGDGGGGAGVPSGLITFVVSGTCPTGWSEVAALNGKAIYGTVAANADVGAAIGSASITPTTASISLTAAAQVFTGNASTEVVNHVHAQGAGTGATGNFVQVTTAVDTSSGGTGATPTQTTLGTRTGNPIAGGVASYTPAGTNGTSATTGTITMNSLVPQFSGVKAIFCSKD